MSKMQTNWMGGCESELFKPNTEGTPQNKGQPCTTAGVRLLTGDALRLLLIQFTHNDEQPRTSLFLLADKNLNCASARSLWQPANPMKLRRIGSSVSFVLGQHIP